MHTSHQPQANPPNFSSSAFDAPWLRRLAELIEQYRDRLGINSDVWAMKLDERWGLYRFLSRLHGEATA